MSAKREEQPAPPRYVVGIDLGTTNSAVAAVDTEAEPWRIETFAVAQLVAPGTVERLETLPSFHYEPAAAETSGDALALPWGEERPPRLVGTLARERGAEVPGRLVSSAKSWLSHAGIDRTAAILPWHGAPEVKKLSPMTVSSRYLEHVRRAWNAAHPEHPLEDQDLVVTVPASFDEIARELTVEAARQAGLARVVLIEEPQAAFYAWIEGHGDRAATLEPGWTVLVVDVGGGTTDLTLIEVEESGDGLRFRRVAVGEHLILGGDNLDLALAHHLEPRLAPDGLAPRQWSVLVHRARQAKEQLLGTGAPEKTTVSLPGAGAKLLGGALAAELGRDEARDVLIEGFLPRVPLDAEPASVSGFRELGLPYAPDSAISRYLARFLRRHAPKGATATDAARPDAARPDAARPDAARPDAARPDAVLFNGGFFAAPVLRERVLELLTSWFDADGENYAPVVLDNPRLDLAVARGAAYFGMVRRGEGERIQGGLAHAYYVGVERAVEPVEPAEPGEIEEEITATAVCLVPAGMEEGSEVVLDRLELELLIREPVEFPIYTSSARSGDRPGDLVAVDPADLKALPPIRTVLRSGKKRGAETVRVHLHAALTEIGTLALWCREARGDRTWRLEFDVRSAVRSEVRAHRGDAEAAGYVPEETVDACRALVARTFDLATGKTERPDRLVARLERAAGMLRHDWPPSLLRALWQTLWRRREGRRLSIAHEARWLNLLGFALRPGFGYAVDDWRVARTWQLFHQQPIHRRNPMCRGEWWVLWRRISGGLSAGQQRALGERLVADRKSVKRPGGHEAAEMVRLLASLEWLDPAVKESLGEEALAAIEKDGPKSFSGAWTWALARLGARVPAYGPANGVVPVETVERWLERLMAIDDDRQALAFAVMQLARRTDDRFRDVSEPLRREIVDWLVGVGAPSHYLELVREGGALERGEEKLVFGDSLPKGLVLR